MNLKTWVLTGTVASLPFLQIIPDLDFLQGLEKVGIIGFLSAVMIWLIWERRFFMLRTTTQITSLESRMSSLETNIASGDERIINLLNAQLETLREIKIGQQENFSRMWTLAMSNNKPKEKKNELANPNG
jgi:uncharacterized coiled-coil protein SlyX